MTTRQASFQCPQCRQPRLFTSTGGINHILHLLITLFMCGLWLPVWIIMAINDTPQYFCSQCGFSDATRYLASPNLRQNERILAERKATSRQRAKNDFLDWIRSSAAYLWAANPRNTGKVIAGTIAFVALGAIGIALFAEFGKQNKPSPVVATIPTQIPVDNNPIVNKLKKDVAEGFAKTTWISNIKSIAVANNRVGVFTDLTSKNEKAGKICSGVSFTYYSYDRAYQTHTVIIYSKSNDILIERNGIADQCK